MSFEENLYKIIEKQDRLSQRLSEGIMGEDYIKASAINYTKGLKGNLLVIHGTGDDNVHYQNTEMLINELVKNNKQFSMMSYPNRTHSISEGKGTSLHLMTLITNYIKQNCPGGGR